MPPYSGMKMIHDQMIEESLEGHRYYSGEETHRQSLPRTFGKVLACFILHTRRKQESLLPVRDQRAAW